MIAFTHLVPLTLAATAFGGQPTPQPDGAVIPGVTVWVYEIDSPLTRRPTIADGQTPNHYAIYQNIDFSDSFKTTFGSLEDSFAGIVRGWIDITTPGDHLFRLRCDDGAALLLDGVVIADTEDQHAENFTASAGIALDKGRHTISILFYEDKGKFDLSLEWRPPGAPEYTLLPSDVLRTEAGQTFATSPGPKRWFYGRDPNRPGDGRPLESVHPLFTLEDFRGPDLRPAVAGMVFLPDGRLAISTWDQTGAVYILDNLITSTPLQDGPSAHQRQPPEPQVTITRFASGLGEPLGIAYWNNDLYITQKQEITRLRDLDGDGVTDEYEAIASGWPASHNYHEFSFNLVPLDKHFYITTSVPLKSGATNYMPGTTPAFAVGDRGSGGPGCAWKIDPATGSIEVFARGLRAPNGLNIGPDGELFGCDNQGAWLPASRLNHIHRDGFYGHQTEPNGTTPAEPPVVWFPHGEVGNSPTEPLLIPSGIYRRQLLVGDVTHGGINRVFIENVDGIAGHYQGCVFQFSQGLEAGVNRLVWGPDGCLYVGGIGSNGNWNHKNKKFGLQRLRPNSDAEFLEMQMVESRADGFLITFTDVVPTNILSQAANYNVHSWRYLPTIEYGGPKIDPKVLRIVEAQPAPDGRSVFLKINGLKPETIVYLRLLNFKSTQSLDPVTTEAWYTLNRISQIPGPAWPIVVTPAIPFTHRPQSAQVLLDSANQSMRAFEHTDGKPCRWKTEEGTLFVPPSAAMNTGGDIVTRDRFGDCFLHIEWLCPPGGSIENQTNANSGVKLQSRYEIQIMNSPAAPHEPKFNEAGAIYRQTAADTNASLGAGVWQSYDIRFRAPRWTDGNKTENARITLWWNGVLVHNNVEIRDKTGMSLPEAPGDHPLLLQSHPSDAMGEVRFRNIWIVPE